MCESFTSGCKVISSTMSQTCKYSIKTPTVRAPRMSETHALLVRATLIVRLLTLPLGTAANKQGESSSIHFLWSHRSVENNVLSPLPTSEAMPPRRRRSWPDPGPKWEGSPVQAPTLWSQHYNQKLALCSTQLRNLVGLRNSPTPC